MTVEFESISKVKKAGKSPKYTIKLSGDMEGIECVLTLKGESEAVITDRIPVFSKDLEIRLIDLNTKLTDFQPKEPAILEDFILGVPVEEVYIEGRCSECGAEMWISPSSEEVHVCFACKKESAAEKNRRKQKEWIKQRRLNSSSEKQSENFVFKLPDETWDEFEERKRLIEDEQFRTERAARAEAQA